MVTFRCNDCDLELTGEAGQIAQCPSCHELQDAPEPVHFYRPGQRTGDALAPCLDCGKSPTAPGFGALHEPSRLVVPGTPEWTEQALGGKPNQWQRDELAWGDVTIETEVGPLTVQKGEEVLLVYPQGDADRVTFLYGPPVTAPGQVEVRLPDGREVLVDPASLSSLREETDQELLARSANPTYAELDLHNFPHGHGGLACPFGFAHHPLPR